MRLLWTTAQGKKNDLPEGRSPSNELLVQEPPLRGCKQIFRRNLAYAKNSLANKRF